MPKITQQVRMATRTWDSSLSPAEAASGVRRGRTQLKEPALPIRVEEGVGQVIPVILRNLEGLVSDAVVEVLRGEDAVSISRPKGPSRGDLVMVGGAPTAREAMRPMGPGEEWSGEEAEGWREPQERKKRDRVAVASRVLKIDRRMENQTHLDPEGQRETGKRNERDED